MTVFTCAYVLAKNEIKNIHDCVKTLGQLQIPVVVLDSGSTDGTLEAIALYPGTAYRAYDYRGHCTAYNELTMRHAENDVILILDADMRIGAALFSEMCAEFDRDRSLQVGIAPIDMLWDGLPLHHASICPPKWIAFRGGCRYFQPVGHGECLLDGVTRKQFRAAIVHDDRKPYAQTLATQWRYALDLSRRSQGNRLTWRDRLRIRTPLMLLITPCYTLFAKLGLLDGKAGVIYALDRLIYEALAYRAALSPLVQNELSKADAPHAQPDLRATTDIKLPTENRVN